MNLTLERQSKTDEQTSLTTKNRTDIGAIFGTRAPGVLRDVSRSKPTITRKNKHGAAIQMLTFNEAKALLVAQGKIFETNAELEKALWDGMKLKDGGLLRDSYSSAKGILTRYRD